MDLRTFLLEAVGVELHAEHAYAQLAADMARAGNAAAQQFFAQLGQYSTLHREEAMRRAGLATLEDFVAARGDLPEGLRGETPTLDFPEDPLSLDEAFGIALEAENNAARLYESVVATSADAAVRQMAAEFAAEEHEHVEALKRFYAQYAALS